MSRIALEPEYIRPSQMAEKFNISRSFAYELIAAGKIKSHVLRRNGNLKGSRLILVESVKEFIASQPEA